MEKMKEKGELDNTLIIFTSNPNAHLGDHDLIHKVIHYERSSHVPIVVWWPGAIKPGHIKGFAPHIDLFPTFVEIAGGVPPGGLERISYYDILTCRGRAPDTAITEILGTTALVTKDYKYGIYRQFREDDLSGRKTDPGEFTNIAGEEEYADLVQQFREHLYRVDPTLKEDFENTPGPVPLPNEVSLVCGVSLRGTECPYLGGKLFQIMTGIETNS